MTIDIRSVKIQCRMEDQRAKKCTHRLLQSVTPGIHTHAVFLMYTIRSQHLLLTSTFTPFTP